MIKPVLLIAGVAVGALVIFAMKEALSISDNAFSIALIGIIGLVVYGQLSKRLETLEGRVAPSGYTGVRAAIEDGPRHIPQHKRPKSLVDGGAIRSFITPADEALFEDFRWFGVLLDRKTPQPWAIEELNDTSVRGFDGPEVGRRYKVYYNSCNMGTIRDGCSANQPSNCNGGDVFAGNEFGEGFGNCRPLRQE